MPGLEREEDSRRSIPVPESGRGDFAPGPFDLTPPRPGLEWIHTLILTPVPMKLRDKNVRKITRIGKTSLAVTLPKEMAHGLGWKEKQKVRVKRVRGGILIRDWH